MELAWSAAAALDNRDRWLELGHAAMATLEVATARDAFRCADEPAMALALDKLEFVEDRNLLAGHILAVAEHNHDAAEQCFLRARAPHEALQMRKDLGHWGAALMLAQQFDPASAPDIMCQHAMQLETGGGTAAALQCYEQALAECTNNENAAANEPADSSRAEARAQLQAQCHAGAARCAIVAGDVRGGMRKALALGRPEVLRDCAAALESSGGVLAEAAELYAAAGASEKACALYIQASAFAKADPLIKAVKSPSLLVQVRHRCCMLSSQSRHLLGSKWQADTAITRAVTDSIKRTGCALHTSMSCMPHV